MFMASLHQQGAEPKRPLCGMQRGGSVVSKGAWQAAAQPDDYCEPDRAQRELLRRARCREAMFMASLHQQGRPPAPIASATPVVMEQER